MRKHLRLLIDGWTRLKKKFDRNNVWQKTAAVMFAFCILMGGIVNAQDVQNVTSKTFAQLTTEARELLHYAPPEVDDKNRKALNRIISVNLIDVPMEDALRYIANLGKLRLAYSTSVGKEYWQRRVSVQYDRATVLGALYAALNGTDLKLTLSTTSGNGQIVVEKDTNATAEELVPVPVFQQEITGRVIDAQTGEALPGVNIVIEGTNTGTTTDAEGTFELSVPTLEETLVISYIGYESLEIPLEGRVQLDIELESEVIAGGELVVVGYGTERRRDLTGAINDVSAQELTKVSVSNTSELLQGRVPGLITKQTTGLPGQNEAQLNIRGFGVPLILVDGIEMSINHLNPEDIESISILKDASAAVYGARAGNGVILVTTKKGAQGSPIINFKSNISFQQPTRMFNFVNAGQWAELLREGELNMELEPTFTAEEVERYKQEEPGYESYDWHDATFKAWAPMQENNLSISGGSEDVRYFVSAGYVDQGSAFRSGEFTYNRYNVRGNVEAYISEDLTASLNLAARRIEQDQPAAGRHGIFNRLGSAHPIYPTSLPDESRVAYGGYLGYNPIAESSREHRGFNDIEQEHLNGILTLNYQIPRIEGLSAEGSLSYRYNTAYQKHLNKTYDAYEYLPDEDEYVRRGTEGSDDLTISNSRFYWVSPKFILRYNQNIGVHRISGLAVAEWIESESRSVETSRREMLAPDAVPFLFAASREGMDNGEEMSESGRASYVGRVQYGYDNRYRLTGTLRADATHAFPEDTRWGYFPSIAASWTLSEESFINIAAVDELRLRLSYSQAGDDSIDPFQHLTGYNILSSVYILGNNPYSIITETGLPNPNITWLDMTTYNAGLDVEFWGGLIHAEFNVFQRTTDNIFGTPQEDFPSTFGATLPQLNINETRDRGFDVLVAHESYGNDWRLYVAANVGYSREKYIRWSEPNYEDEDEIRLFQNESHYTNRIIGYKSDGIFMSQEEIDNHSVDQDGNGNSTLRPGDIRYVDLNGDGEINWRDQAEIGRGVFPDISYGLNIDFGYKNFEISALFQGASGFNIEVDGQTRGTFGAMKNPLELHYKYRWRPDPDNPSQNINPDARLPAINGSGQGVNENNDRTSDFWWLDGTYLRLKNLNITYNLPATLLSEIGIRSASVFVSGSNLFTIDRLGIYSDSIDPEIGSETHTSHGSYPTVRTVSLGFNVRF